MDKHTTVTLGKYFDEYVQAEIASGRFDSISEVIRSGLRLLENQNYKIAQINEALEIGENSGTPKSFDNELFLKRMRKKFNVDA